jgi:peptide deformylase
MIYPIVVYGSPVLRKVGEEISKDYPGFAKLMDDMWETMYHSDGIGLAAPQIGKPIRLFVIDADVLKEDYPEAEGFKQAFINAKMIDETGDKWDFNEGCLSLPTLREDVTRHSKIKIQFYDEDFNFHEKEFDGVVARIIQHEYDHIEGKLLIDHLTPLKKKLLKGKLAAISKGKVDIAYKIKLGVK